MDHEKTSDNSTLTPLERSRWKKIVWIVQIKYLRSPKKEKCQEYGTAFALTKDGLLMTSAHFFPKPPYEVMVRRLDEERFNLEAEVVNLKPKWDMTLLKVKFVDSFDCHFGKLADDGYLFESQILYHIGNPEDFVGSFLEGKVAYECTDDVDLPTPTSGRMCNDYECTALEITPKYRVMGHVWNEAVFDKLEGARTFEKNIHPLVPIIQMYGFHCRNGCSGGPVFNAKGDIVGMIAMGAEGFDIAVHVSMLREFLRLYRGHSIGDGDVKRKDSPNLLQGGDSKKGKTLGGKGTHA